MIYHDYIGKKTDVTDVGNSLTYLIMLDQLCPKHEGELALESSAKSVFGL